jgi:spermidine synthase
VGSILLLIGGGGLTAAVAQVVLARELLVVFDGNELNLGLLLSCWLLLVALGCCAGSRLVPERSASRALPALLFLLCLAAIGQVAAARVVRGMLGIQFGEAMPIGSAAAAVAIVLAPVCLLVGAQFAVACRAGERIDADAPRKVYLAEGAGAAVGGALATFAVVPHVSNLEAGVLVLAVGAAVVWGAACVSAGRLCLHWSGLLVLAGAVALALRLPARADMALLRRQWLPLRLIEVVNSRYGSIVAARHAGQLSFYVNGRYVASAADPLAVAQTAHLCLLEHERPKSVLLIGGAASGIIPVMLSHHLQRIVYVELDPGLIDVVRRLSHGSDGLSEPRVKAVFSDARRFVQGCRERFDVILVDLPGPETVLLSRFYTLEFFQQARRLLGSGGVLALHLPASANYYSDEALALHATVWQTIKRVFPRILATPSEPRYFFASATGEITLNPEPLIRRFRERSVPTTNFHPYLLYDILDAARASEVERALRSTSAPISTDLRPISCFGAQRMWNLVTGSLPPRALRWLDAHPWQALGAIVGLFILPGLGWLFKRGRRMAVAGTVAAFGMAGMVAEVGLLIAFQAARGYVYEHIGAILGAFMAGLVIGAWLPARIPALVRKPRGSLIALQALAAGYFLAMPALVGIIGQGGAGVLVFYLLVVAVGVLVGLAYPICVSLTGRRSGASLYAADLAGACVGALSAGAFILPLLGVASASWALAALFAALVATTTWGLPRPCPVDS